MGVEYIALALRMVAGANDARKALQEVMDSQTVQAIGKVSNLTAERLFAEASQLRGPELKASLEQVAIMLELALESADQVKLPWYAELFTLQSAPMSAQIERLIWLASLYTIIGYKSKSRLRVQDALNRIVELENTFRDEYDQSARVSLWDGRSMGAGLGNLHQRLRENLAYTAELRVACGFLGGYVDGEISGPPN